MQHSKSLMVDNIKASVWVDFRQRSYHCECTGSRRAWLVLWWVTAREHRVLLAFLFFWFFFFALWFINRFQLVIIFALVLISNAILHPNCKSRGRQYKIAFGCVSTTFSISVRGASHVRNDSKTLCLLYVTPTPCSHSSQAYTHLQSPLGCHSLHGEVCRSAYLNPWCFSTPNYFWRTSLFFKYYCIKSYSNEQNHDDKT